MTHDVQARPGLGAPADAEEEDPVVEECIKDALTPYVGVLSPEELTDYRRFLILFMTTHPTAAPLYQRLRKRPVLDESGDVPRDGAAVDEETPPARGAGTSRGSR